MSRTRNTTGTSSPVKRYLSWTGKGQIKFYDKDNEKADDKGNVYLDKLDLTVVDIKASVSGFNEGSNSGINSNLLNIYDTGKEEFVVKTKINGSYGEFTRGIWREIKDEVSNIGGKFTTNIFAIADVGYGNEMVKLELNGASLTPWIEFKEDKSDEDIYDLLITISKGQLCTRKKGETSPVSDAEYKKVVAAIKKDPMTERPVWFTVPKFVGGDLSEELVNEAVEADEVLQEYFDGLGVNKSEDNSSEEGQEESPTATNPVPAQGISDEEGGLPF